MGMSGQKGFEGWYFKHQKGDDMAAFIPGRAESGAFIQVISQEGARQFEVSNLTVRGGMIRADQCCFSRQGCRIDLPGVSGEITYGPFAPLGSDIMGPFRFFPMECRHGVVSMAHTLQGSVRMDGCTHSFDGGLGYIEKDSGTSFPCSYLWLQCSDFPKPCSLMLSIAHVPFCASSFRGCICAVLYQGREYRLVTYRGVKILSFSPEHICLSQGGLLLELDIAPPMRATRFVPLSAERCSVPFGKAATRICGQGCGSEEKQYSILKVTMPPMNSSQIMGRKRKNILFSFLITLWSKQALGRSVWNHYGSKPGSGRTFRPRTEI